MDGIEIDVILMAASVIIVLYTVLNPVIKNKYFAADKSSITKLFFQVFFALLMALAGLAIHYHPVSTEVDTVFVMPEYRGNKIDNCLYDNGVDCGNITANLWCQQQNYSKASDFKIEDVSKLGGISERLGDNYQCKPEDKCSSFVFIKCRR